MIFKLKSDLFYLQAFRSRPKETEADADLNSAI